MKRKCLLDGAMSSLINKFRKAINFILVHMLATNIFSLEQEYVVGSLQGQLGNQLFIIAATVNLALDHNAIPVFPELLYKTENAMPLNFQKIFPTINTQLPSQISITTKYEDHKSGYTPIPYSPNMEIFGYFQSEKYFANHKAEIINLFAPSKEIIDYLAHHYRHIIEHPNSVAIHTRSYFREDPKEVIHLTYGRDYVLKAMNLFPNDSLFVIFSNDMAWCKSILANIPKNMIFIEGEPHYHDFYLMSMCKHNIICNSSFSWWAAYLNQNPGKSVITPKNWFNTDYISNTNDLRPTNWIEIE